MLIDQGLIDRYLSELESRGFSAGSIKSYRRTFVCLLEMLDGAELDESSGLKFHDWMLQEKKWRPQTVNSRMTTYNSFVAWLGYKNWQVDLVCQRSVTQNEELTLDEYYAMLQAAVKLSARLPYIIIRLMGSAGFRSQELLQLSYEDVVAGKATVLRHNNACEREVLITGDLQKEVLAYCEENGITSGKIFMTKVGTEILGSSLSEKIQRAGAAAGVSLKKCNGLTLVRFYEKRLNHIREQFEPNIQNKFREELRYEQKACGWDNMQHRLRKAVS